MSRMAQAQSRAELLISLELKIVVTCDPVPKFEFELFLRRSNESLFGTLRTKGLKRKSRVGRHLSSQFCATSLSMEVIFYWYSSSARSDHLAPLIFAMKPSM